MSGAVVDRAWSCVFAEEAARSSSQADKVLKAAQAAVQAGAFVRLKDGDYMPGWQAAVLCWLEVAAGCARSPADAAYPASCWLAADAGWSEHERDCALSIAAEQLSGGCGLTAGWTDKQQAVLIPARAVPKCSLGAADLLQAGVAAQAQCLVREGCRRVALKASWFPGLPLFVAGSSAESAWFKLLEGLSPEPQC